MAALSTENKRFAQMPGQASDNKRKVIIAIVLVIVMGLLWTKVLLAEKAGPGDANAGTTAGQDGVTAEGGGKVKIEYTKLPVVVGRHDILMNDMFGVKDWCDEKPVTQVETVVEPTRYVSGDPISQGQLEKIIDKIEVKMILVGENGRQPEVFINDKLMTIGSKLKVERDSGTYELLIKKISKNEVILECEGVAAAISMLDQNGITN